ncbi:PorT family protein [Parapedobacter tibetensis]|uniref:PorT family protein n=1 Tax=Parapedobacter tibetensis TaxID=2972951 RepID=UPI00214D3EDF|nr:PorT family protein [Parapedobacter tibetensis]
MKSISLTVLCCATVLMAPAQEKKRIDSLRRGGGFPADTVIMEDVKTGEKRKVRIIIPGKDEGMITIEKSEKAYKLDSNETNGKEHVKVTTSHPKTSYPIYGITFSRIDLGLAKLLDNGSFSLSDNNRDFRYRPGKTVNFGFDLLQAGYRFNDNFRIFLSGGFDWTYIRLRENIDFLENTTPLTWEHAEVDYSKNRLTSTYLRLPLTFELRSKYYNGLGRLRFAFGPEGGFLLKGTQRFKSGELGKQKFKDNYNFTQFRYGAFARFGVGAFGIYAKYYFNDIFENSPNQEGLQNFTFGLMLGF